MKEANIFIREQFKKAWSAETREEALFEFGVALHTLQDSTSPSHSGFKEWSGKETLTEKIEHVGKELFNQSDDSELFKATKTAWEWFDSGKLPDGNLFVFESD